MPSGLSSDTKERVRQAIDIVDLVGDYLQLRREGNAFKALCPWHNDSRPSLHVNPERQSFRCWVCDIGGDIFSFVMKMEGVTFPEALEMLAERANVPLGPRGAGQSDAKRALFQAMAWAQQQYHDCLLNAPEAEPARNYLDSRGISPEMIRKFLLGFAPPSWDWIIRQARDTRLTPKMLEQIGIAVPGNQGPFDRFHGRVLFSIRDPQARAVGLGGRILPGTDDSRAAKYINTPETPLFSKSSLLYGLDVARDALSRTRTAVVMEGYTDCLIAQQFGIHNALAVLGTALGERHIKLLRRYVDRIVLVLDGDEAGQRRTDQILELFIAEGMDLRVLTLPEGLDPCDFLLQRGVETFQALLDGAVDALEHRYRRATNAVDPTRDTHAANKAVESILATLARVGNADQSVIRLRVDQTLHRMARQFGIEETRLRERMRELRKQNSRRGGKPVEDDPPAPVEKISSRRALAERWLLEILIADPQWLIKAKDELAAVHMLCPRRRQVFAQLQAIAATGTLPTFQSLMLELDDPDVKSTLVDLDEQGRARQREDVAKELRDLLLTLREASVETPAPAPADPSDPAHSLEARQMDSLRRLIEQKRSRPGTSQFTDE